MATVSEDSPHQVTGMTSITICWLLVAILIAKMLINNTILTVPRQNTEMYKCIAFVTEYHFKFPSEQSSYFTKPKLSHSLLWLDIPGHIFFTFLLAYSFRL
jgi:hypothetical protein